MERQASAPGNSLLKSAGILMIVFGSFCTLLYALGLAVVLGISYVTSGLFSGIGDMIGMGLLLAAGITELIAGILGIKAARKPNRAGSAMVVWCILCLLLTLVGFVHIALRTPATWWKPAFGAVLSCALPIAYLAARKR